MPKKRAEPMTKNVTALLATQRPALQHHLPVARQQAGQHAQQRRLAGAVGADDGHPASGRQPQIDGLQNALPPDAGAGHGRAQHRAHFNPPYRAPRCIRHSR